jgi:hypothetical protein
VHCQIHVKERLDMMKDNMKAVNKMKQISDAKMSHSKKSSKEQKDEWMTKADKLFDLLTPDAQDMFLEKIKDKI